MQKAIEVNQNFKAFAFDAYGTFYNVQSVEETVEAAFPGKGSLITSVWRMKQLEYSWLATLMERYEDFWSLTLRSLNYTLRSLGLSADSQLLQDVAAAYLNLKPYDYARSCLERLHPRAILSNGSRSMLSSLTANSGLQRFLDNILSVDAGRRLQARATGLQSGGGGTGRGALRRQGHCGSCGSLWNGRAHPLRPYARQCRSAGLSRRFYRSFACGNP